MRQKVLKVGNSAGILVPKSFLKRHMIQVGDEIEIEEDGIKVTRKKHSSITSSFLGSVEQCFIGIQDLFPKVFDPPATSFLTQSQVLVIQAIILEKLGGKAGLRGEWILHAVLDKVHKVQEEKILDLVVTFFSQINALQPFIDRNFETALLSVLLFLETQDIDYQLKKKDLSFLEKHREDEEKLREFFGEVVA